jgi:hypothetical protein
MGAKGLLVIAGVACLALAFLAMRKLIPRRGEPAPAWASADSWASAIAISLLMLMLAGAGLLVKGLFGG